MCARLLFSFVHIFPVFFFSVGWYFGIYLLSGIEEGSAHHTFFTQQYVPIRIRRHYSVSKWKRRKYNIFRKISWHIHVASWKLLKHTHTHTRWTEDTIKCYLIQFSILNCQFTYNRDCWFFHRLHYFIGNFQFSFFFLRFRRRRRLFLLFFPSLFRERVQKRH